MTPKQKAEQLVDKFYQTTPNEAWYNPPLGSASMEYKAWEQAKQCAIIAINELIISTWKEESIAEYWRQVKREIERLQTV